MLRMRVQLFPELDKGLMIHVIWVAGSGSIHYLSVLLIKVSEIRLIWPSFHCKSFVRDIHFHRLMRANVGLLAVFSSKVLEITTVRLGFCLLLFRLIILSS